MMVVQQSALPLLLMEALLSSRCLGLDFSSWLWQDYKLTSTEFAKKKKLNEEKILKTFEWWKACLCSHCLQNWWTRVNWSSFENIRWWLPLILVSLMNLWCRSQMNLFIENLVMRIIDWNGLKNHHMLCVDNRLFLCLRGLTILKDLEQVEIVHMMKIGMWSMTLGWLVVLFRFLLLLVTIDGHALGVCLMESKCWF